MFINLLKEYIIQKLKSVMNLFINLIVSSFKAVGCFRLLRSIFAAFLREEIASLGKEAQH